MPLAGAPLDPIDPALDDEKSAKRTFCSRLRLRSHVGIELIQCRAAIPTEQRHPFLSLHAQSSLATEGVHVQPMCKSIQSFEGEFYAAIARAPSLRASRASSAACGTLSVTIAGKLLS